MTRPINVDGPRPAVSWVCSLPRGWTSSNERLVLLLLALDSYDPKPPIQSALSLDQMAAAAGLFKGRVAEALRSLANANDQRPALLSTTPGRGKKASTHELLIDAYRSGWTDHYADPLRSGQPDYYGTATPGLRSGHPDYKRSRSGPASGPGGGPGGRTTPFPSPSTHLPAQPSDRAHEPRCACGARLTVDNTCARGCDVSTQRTETA